ncbi:MAG: HlyD family efflux transporter periplasmic adaptor subunit [Pelomonas sp.]|nr:HlyD family efflux transporter periplasmic adaptor subunit [Roseateles sp.]
MASPFSRTLRALDADGPGRSWMGWAVAGMLLLAWLAWFFGGEVTLFEASRSARVEAVAAAHPVTAAQAGRLVRASRRLGERVNAGDVLFELDDQAAALSLREESGRLAAVPEAREALQAELRALHSAGRQAAEAGDAAVQVARERRAEVASQLAVAREHERRLADEARAGGVAEMDLLRARAESRRLASQQAGLDAEALRLMRETRARAAQLQAQRETVQGRLTALASDAQALATRVQRLQAARERLQLRAPVGGVLAEVAPVQAGAWVSEGQALATVLPVDRLRVVAEFAPGTALGRVREGQVAVLRLEGFPWLQHGSLGARVERVAGEVRDQRLRVELALDGVQTRTGLPLQHGLSGQVEIALEAVSPAQLLLRSLGAR